MSEEKNFFNKLQNYIIIQAIRRGLVTLIPVLMVGSFSLVLYSLPVTAYQDFVTTWADGLIYQVFHMIYQVTFGMLSVYMAMAVGYHYGILHIEKKQLGRTEQYGALIVSLGCFFLCSGASDSYDEVFGARGMFVAILTSALASKLYYHIIKRRKETMILSDGSDIRLGTAISAIYPAACVFFIFEVCNYAILTIFDVSSIYELISLVIQKLFDLVGDGLPSAVFFVLLSSILWLFGLHGSNLLENEAEHIFDASTTVNLDLVALGQAPTEILTREFLNNFVLMGGCGVSLSLLLALLIFSKRNSNYNLTKMAVFPMLFNVNEIMVFGLPIVLNPIFVIPFICTPIACFFVTYLAMSTGLVPLVTSSVEWTTPVILSGYLTTGSIAGSILQIINLFIGVAIYAPFVKMYDRQKLADSKQYYEQMVELLKKSESSKIPVMLTDNSATSYGWLGKALAADLMYALEKGELKLFYQPQYYVDDRCIGAEALLRWNHPVYGNIYPPLVFKLAEETGNLEKMEEWVVKQAVEASKNIKKLYPKQNLKMSVNVTGTTIQKDEFEAFLKELGKKEKIKNQKICLEITEQAALQIDDRMQERFLRIREMGYMLAVDDFSMGSTSIQYLIGNHFNLVKLDGALVKGMIQNSRCMDIISSIISLSKQLEMDVLAEYVSSEEIRDKLKEIGCYMYQGWYYSPAVEYDAFVELLKNND